MRDKMTVVIANCSDEFCTEFSAALLKHNQFQLIGIADDQVQAIRMCKEKAPDILLLKASDAEAVIEQIKNLGYLPDSANSGINFELAATKALHDTGMPANILGYTYLLEALRIAIDNPASVQNAAKIIYAPIAEQFRTTPSQVRQAILRAIKIGWDRGDLDVLESYFGHTVYNTRMYPTCSEYISIVAEKLRLQLKAEQTVSHLTAENKKIDSLVTEILHKIPIPAHIKGYQYLREAIIITAQDAHYLTAIPSRVYPVVADKFSTTVSRVERAMQHAVEMAWDKGSVVVLHDIFGCTISNTKGKPTNSEFISRISEIVRIQMNSR